MSDRPLCECHGEPMCLNDRKRGYWTCAVKRREQQAERYRANRAAILEQRQAYRDAHRDEMREQWRAWRDANLERRRAQNRASRARHVEQERQRSRDWRAQRTEAQYAQCLQHSINHYRRKADRRDAETLSDLTGS